MLRVAASHLSNCTLLRAAAVRRACSSPKGVSVDSSLSPYNSNLDTISSGLSNP